MHINGIRRETGEKRLVWLKFNLVQYCVCNSMLKSPFYVCADRYVICADLFLRMRGKFTIICAFQLRGF